MLDEGKDGSAPAVCGAKGPSAAVCGAKGPSAADGWPTSAGAEAGCKSASIRGNLIAISVQAV